MSFETDFSTTGADETIDSPAIEEVQETAVDETTPDDGAVEQTSETTDDVQGDIPDTTAQAQTVPYDRFHEVIQDNKQLKEQLNKLLELQLKTVQPQQQAQEQKAPEYDIDDDAFLTGADVKRILNNLEQRRIAETQNITQTTREQMLIQHETSFRQTNPDYDTVISHIPKPIIGALMQSFKNPGELVQEAYRIGKAYAPTKASAADVAAKAKQQPVKKAVTLNDVKGTGSIDKEEKVSFESDFAASIGK